jgi:predicted ABC-type transport system involved in lysophospholipase L1 biosynthesis ATPase subunit
MMVSHDESLGTRFDRVLRLDDIAVTDRRAAA